MGEGGLYASYYLPMFHEVFLGGANGKEPACKCNRHKRCRFDPWVGKMPWKRAWQPTPVFLPGEPHGQRSLAGHSPGVAESDATERLSRSTEQALGRSESCCGASQLTPDSADGRSKAQRGCVAALGLRSWHVEDRGLETLPLLTRVMCLLYQAA